MEGSRGGILQTVEAIEGVEAQSRRYHWALQRQVCGEGKLADVGPWSGLAPKLVHYFKKTSSCFKEKDCTFGTWHSN
jgi:hypothetical protein